MITLEVIGDIPYLRRNSEFCKPRDATASDYIVLHVVGVPSVLMSMKLPTLLSTLQLLMLEWKMKILYEIFAKRRSR